MLNLGGATFLLSGGNLPQDIDSHIALDADSRAIGTNRSRLAFSLSTGVFVGHVVNPADPRRRLIPFGGVVLRKQNVGLGFFTGTNQCGGVYLGR